MKRNKDIPVKMNEALHEIASLTEQPNININDATIVEMSMFHNHGFSLFKEEPETAGTLVARDYKGARHFIIYKLMFDGQCHQRIRKLTVIEYERLMGWDDDHTRFRADGTEISTSQRYKMCGNGVVAPVATWIGERITPLLRPTESDTE